MRYRSYFFLPLTLAVVFPAGRTMMMADSELLGGNFGRVFVGVWLTATNGDG
jgi:hypothetical protein